MKNIRRLFVVICLYVHGTYASDDNMKAKVTEIHWALIDDSDDNYEGIGIHRHGEDLIYVYEHDKINNSYEEKRFLARTLFSRGSATSQEFNDTKKLVTEFLALHPEKNNRVLRVATRN